jgi:lycopene cyclase CruA
MQQLLYLEIPTPDTAAVRTWLQQEWPCDRAQKHVTPDGLRLKVDREAAELSIFVWSLQRTTYLKVFRWGEQKIAGEKSILTELSASLRRQFPYHYPEPPAIDLTQHSIFEALAADYPKTVQYFQKIPNGEADLIRAYWWEKRWREGVRNPQQPKQVVFLQPKSSTVPAPASDVSPNPPQDLTYDLIYVGGALGVIHAAVMAKRGYRVLLLERLPFGRMNREWNISRGEFQNLIDLGLFTAAEFESLIAAEYTDGFNKFFDANNPPQCRAQVLHTPLVLNVAIDAEKLLRLCGEKLRAAGGEIWDETEFIRADISPTDVVVNVQHLPTGTHKHATGRLLVDAMGSASPIAWQLNGGRAFDSVCPTVGAVISGGFEPGVWDVQYGDVLNSHGDISRGRQLIWELFPATGNELTIYLFHYHQVHPDNPGSLLEMYEDFFTILPEYRRCDVDQLTWKKATFGYIPGHFSQNGSDRTVAIDRVIAIGDAASLQSPLIFTGFGSLVRNMARLTELLDTALQYNLLSATHLDRIRAYQSNVAVTWLFSKGMMVPTGQHIAPERVNAMLNTFFGLLAGEPQEVADTFIKDRTTWWMFNRLAVKAAWQNPSLLLWIWELAGPSDMLRWLGSYLTFTWQSVMSLLLGWLPGLGRRLQPWLAAVQPSLWLWVLATSYMLTEGVGYKYQGSGDR